MWRLALALVVIGCHPVGRPTEPRRLPTPSVQVGACAKPGQDGVISGSPKLERADRDLNGDGTAETIVTDRAMCSADGNCYWNVFVAGNGAECTRFAGTFEGSALEPLTSRGDDNMVDVRSYYNLHGGRLVLQSYRFSRGGYGIVDALLCKRGSDDQLECAESEH